MFESFKNLWARSYKLEVVLDDAAYDSTNKNACESSCGIIEGNATDVKILGQMVYESDWWWNF